CIPRQGELGQCDELIVQLVNVHHLDLQERSQQVEVGDLRLEPAGRADDDALPRVGQAALADQTARKVNQRLQAPGEVPRPVAELGDPLQLHTAAAALVVGRQALGAESAVRRVRVE